MIGAVDFNNLDSGAIQISLYSLLTIFIVIVVLVLFFAVIPRLISSLKGSGSKNNSNANGGKSNSNSNIPAGDSAVIAAAIYLFLDEIHDNENRVVTIKRVSRTYSPWNSKIYGINWIKNR